jgi:hypothetical protein
MGAQTQITGIWKTQTFFFAFEKSLQSVYGIRFCMNTKEPPFLKQRTIFNKGKTLNCENCTRSVKGSDGHFHEWTLDSAMYSA